MAEVDAKKEAPKKKQVQPSMLGFLSKGSTPRQSMPKRKSASGTDVVAKKPKDIETGPDVELAQLSDLLTEPLWKEKLKKEFLLDYFQKLNDSLVTEFKTKEIFPPKQFIFNAFHRTPFNKVKVLILGQDPYHDNNQAHGLCFSVQHGVAVPPSLKNIYKELLTDIEGFKQPTHGCLDQWADQGILLLNATLTVQAHKANSHAKLGWQTFTDHVIQKLSDEGDKIVFILWGGFAQKKEKLINTSKHCVIKGAHPSPLSVTKFRGCKHFSKTNEALKKFKKSPIDWHLD